MASAQTAAPVSSSPLRSFSLLAHHLRGIALFAPWLAYLLFADVLLSLLLPLKPFLPNSTYNLSSNIAGSVWHWIQYIFVRANAAPIVVAGDKLPNGESAIVVANHIAWTDFYLIQEAAVRAGMLKRCRWFAKQQLRWVPFLGWGLWAMGMPLVSRRWATDKKELEKVFFGVVKRKWPVWLIAYSEGTRFTSARYHETVKWCEANHRPVPKHTLWPRTRGFIATVNALRKAPHVRAVYDLTLAYAHGERFMQAPSFWDTIASGDLEKAGYKFYVHVDRYELKDLPHTDDELIKWLEDRWLQKDQRLEKLSQSLRAGHWVPQ